MAEEKKEEKVEAKIEAPQAVPEAKPAAAAVPEEPSAQPAVPLKKEDKPQAKKEKPSNCAACNKSIRKKRWYYRNGKFYCTERCWKSTLKKESKQEEAKGAPAQK